MTTSNDVLFSCVNSLNASVDLLNNSLRSLEDTTKNVPRLKRVLRTHKVFGLVPELDLEHANKTIHEELQPQINDLNTKVVTEINRLRRKKVNLTNKIELQRVRLQSIGSKNDYNGVKGISGKRIAKGDLDELKLARLKLLQNKKERLRYSLSRMKLQDKRARLSMIPSLPPDN